MKVRNVYKSLVQFFDIIFIMVLCLTTLFSTMIMRGAVIIGSNSGAGMEYSFNITTFGIVAISLAIYLLFILPQSNRELKLMIREIYDADEKDSGNKYEKDIK